MKETVVARAACHTRVSSTNEPTAALELDATVPEPDGLGEDTPVWLLEAVTMREAELRVEEGEADPDAGPDADADATPDDEAAPEPEIGPDVTPLGGGTAFEGSARAPVPQGMGSPPGWFALAGGVVAPLDEAMVNRVVHVLSGEPGAVNW